MARTFALLLTLFSAMPTYADVVAAAEGSSNSSTASNLSVADEKVKVIPSTNIGHLRN